MDQVEAYLYLFSDAIFSGLIFYADSELVIDVMKIFGGYNHNLIILLSIIGNFIASLINFLFGKICRKIKKADVIITTNKNYPIVNKFVKIFLPILLFSSPLPTFGAIIMYFIGLLNTQLKYHYFFYIIFGKIIYYMYKMNL